MIYLNNAATSYPKPKQVIDALNSYFCGMPVSPSRSSNNDEDVDVVLSCRIKIAKLINAPDPLNIIFSSGSTESLNLIIRGLDLKNAHVIASATEHNSVIRPLNHRAKEDDILVSFVACDEFGFVSPEDIRKEIRTNTKAIIINFSSNVTGAVQDLESIGKIARDHGLLFVVDASQGIGAVELDVEKMNIDLLAFTGHKSMYGIQGIGGLFIRQGIDLKPLKTGGTGSKSNLLYQPEDIPLKYEAGTQNLPGIIALESGVDWVLNTGLNKIQNHKKSLIQHLFNTYENEKRIKIYTPKSNSNHSVFTFNIGEMAPEEVAYMLESSFEIKARSGLHCAPLIQKYIGTHPWGTVRISPSYFTKIDEIEHFIESINKIIKSFVK